MFDDALLPALENNDAEMARIMRLTNWAQSPLGVPNDWPASLLPIVNIVLHSPQPMLLCWGADRLCFYNDAFLPCLAGKSHHPALGLTGDTIWTGSLGFIEKLVDSVLATGKPASFKEQSIGPLGGQMKGEVFWTFNATPVAGDSGKTTGALLICEDTTDKVTMLDRLEESNRLYYFAIDASELGTWDLNPLTSQFLANDRLKKWFGLDSDGPLDLSEALNCIHEKDRERIARSIQVTLEDHRDGHYDVEYAIKNAVTGEQRVVKAIGKARFDDQGRPYQFNGTMRDITLEVAARETGQKLSVLVENSVDLMAILGLDGKNTYINSAGRKLLGIGADADATQIPISAFHTPEQLSFVESEILPSVMATGKWSGTFAIRNMATSEIIPLQNNCHRIDDRRTGIPIGVGTVMRDIRNELNIQERLEDEVRERTRELIKLNEQLERKNKDLASFAFVSSHDLQEPLRKITTFISRIEETAPALSGKNAEYFDKIKKSVLRMQSLIRDLLSFSRLTADRLQLDPTDLGPILAETISEYQSQIQQSGGSVELCRLPVVDVIAFQVRQLFDNLLANAIKFARTDQPLRVTVGYTQKQFVTADGHKTESIYHCITFRDNGIGFADEYKERIFEVFQRLHSREQFEGTGIGLAICKKIMENHRGHITANGFPNEGALFQLYFPIQHEE